MAGDRWMWNEDICSGHECICDCDHCAWADKVIEAEEERMTREEAVNRFKGIRKSFSVSIAQSKFYPSKAILDELCDMAIEALNREQQIIENGYTGKEMRIRIGGKLFAVRELAQ